MTLPGLSHLYKVLFTICSINSFIQLCAGRTYHKIYNNRLLSYTYSTHASSIIECCSMCDAATNCKSINYNRSTKECQISSVGLKSVDVKSEVNEDWVTCSRHGNGLLLMFQGVAGLGTDVYDAWLTGKNTTQLDVKCMQKSVTDCTTHFRSRLVNDWFILGIKKVRFSLYKDGVEYRYITFNGTGANLENWFDQSKVIFSNMKDVDKVTGTHFSMAGFAPSRRFHISNVYNKCEFDRLMVLVLTSGYYNCDYEKEGPYPQILFAYPDTWANANNGEGMKSADAFRISVRLL